MTGTSGPSRSLSVGDDCPVCERPITELLAGGLLAYCWWCNDRHQTLDRAEYPECEGQDCSNDATTLLKLSGATKDEMVVCDDDECYPFWMGPGAPSIEDRIPLTPGIVAERSSRTEGA